MPTLLQDLRYGFRTMLRSPGVTLIAVLSLALGIGANTAIFSLIDAVMLRTLPVDNPGRLVLFGEGRQTGNVGGFPDQNWELFSYPFYREIRQKNQVFSGVLAIQSLPSFVHGTVAGSADIEKLEAQLVSGTYFSVLGVQPVVGRIFSDADDQTPGGHPVAVVSYSWWNRRFARDPSLVGKTVTILSTVYTVVGVAPPEFFGTAVGRSPDLWIPLAMEKQVTPFWNGLDAEYFQSLYIMGRLKPGVSTAQAGTNVNLLFKQALHAYAGPQPSQEQLAKIEHAHINLTRAATGLSQLRLQFSLPLRILMAVVALVLLIACANIANLLLARGTNRHREIALRMAVGAGRWRLIRQLLTESLLLSLLGGALGIAFASWASRLLVVMVSAGPQPLPVDVAPDARTLAFTLLVSLATAILFGTMPALRATRLELIPSLKEGGGPASTQVRSPLARVLIVSQVALSLVLLVGAGLFLRSLVNLTNVKTGFDKPNVLMFQVDEWSNGYQGERLANLYNQIEERVSSQPGVRAASFSSFTFNQGSSTNNIFTEGRPDPGTSPPVMHNVVGPGYFRTLGIPLVTGRTFGPQDSDKSTRVAVINETAARLFFPEGSAVGRRFGMMGGPEHRPDIEVVGVVKDAKYQSLDEKPQPAAYYPHSQTPPQLIPYLPYFEVRFSGNPAAIIAEVRQAIAAVDRNLPVSDVTTLDEQVSRSVLDQRLVAQLSSFFGLLAVCLACIGLYGLMSYAVSQRTHEIGIRMALGAGRAAVLWTVMRETLLLVAVGLVVGVPVVLACSRLVSSLLFGLTPTDPATILTATALLLGVATLAGYLPARRATKVDPIVALRYE